MEKCKACNGTGRWKWEADDLIPDEECAACHGKGQVEYALNVIEAQANAPAKPSSGYGTDPTWPGPGAGED